MISPLSFGSTYKVYSKENEKNIVNYFATINFCESDFGERLGIKLLENYKNNSCSIISPNDKDSYIETYMANKGIVYHKFDSDKFMSPRMIRARVKNAPKKDLFRVNIDTEKFEKMVKNSDGNFGHCRENYNKYYKENLEAQIKSGEEIPATSLYLIPKISDLGEFIDTYGVENVDKHMLDTIFNMSYTTEDSSMYFAMKDTGMKQIPVYMNKESYDLAKKIGILAE